MSSRSCWSADRPSEQRGRRGTPGPAAGGGCTGSSSVPPTRKEEIRLMREPHVIGFEEYEPGPIQAGQVRLRTLYSGISAGTEMTIYRGSNPYGHKKWDPALKLFLS